MAKVSLNTVKATLYLIRQFVLFFYFIKNIFIALKNMLKFKVPKVSLIVLELYKVI